ncbi:cation efflux protein/ zinc transporter, putative, partial [Ixodes scapularis]
IMETDGCAKLYAALALSGLFFVAEIIASHVTHSLVLLIYSYQMLYNVLALVLLVISYHICQERTLKNTFGWARVEVLGTLVNMLFLMALCFAISVAAVQTIVHASHENTEPHYPMLLLCFGIIGLSSTSVEKPARLQPGHRERYRRPVQLRGRRRLEFRGRDSAALPSAPRRRHSQAAGGAVAAAGRHHRPFGVGRYTYISCLLEAVRTCGGCLMVVGCACAVHFGSGLLPRYVDPVLAVVAVAILICTSYPRMKESGLILLQNIPNNMDIDTMQKKLLEKFPAILNVHEFHLWQLTNTRAIATVHIVVGSHAVYIAIADKVSRFFYEQGISSMTVQPEFCQV